MQYYKVHSHLSSMFVLVFGQNDNDYYIAIMTVNNNLVAVRLKLQLYSLAFGFIILKLDVCFLKFSGTKNKKVVQFRNAKSMKCSL